jgi:YjbE family integral membrane protein
MPASSFPRLMVDCLSIILIDLLLAGDNALVIAMAVRFLPPPQRRIGITLGAAAAVTLRVLITIAAAQLLNIEFVKLLGGALVIWIAVKVFADTRSSPAASPSAGHFLRAIWLIMLADITMSTDNILAVAGASRGNVVLIVFGLCVSIPFVVFASNLIAWLMDRYAWIMYLGAAILGKVGGEMILTDPVVVRTLHPSHALMYAAEALAIVGILVAGRIVSEPARNAGPVI